MIRKQSVGISIPQSQYNINYSNRLQPRVSRDFNIFLKFFCQFIHFLQAQKKVKLTQTQALTFTEWLHHIRHYVRDFVNSLILIYANYS